MTSALHLLLLSFILLLVRPTTGTDNDLLPNEYHDVPDYEASREYYKICERYTEGRLPHMNKLLGYNIVNGPKESEEAMKALFDILDRIRGATDEFGALKSKISRKLTYTDPAKLIKNSKRPYRELDNAIRADLITLVAKSETRARETFVRARGTFDTANVEHQDHNLSYYKEQHKEFQKRIRENGGNDIVTILENGYKDIERYCDMAKQVQAISYYIKKADRVESIAAAQRTAPRGTKGGFTLNGWDYGTVWDALEEFKRKSGYNEEKGEEEDYKKEDWELRGKYDGTKYEVAHKALAKFKSMRTIWFGALAKMITTCRAEVKDQTIRGYASDFKDSCDLADESETEAKPTVVATLLGHMNLDDDYQNIKKKLEKATNWIATDLEHVADTIKKIWVVITEDYPAEDYEDDVKLQKDIMKILEADATLDALVSYERLSAVVRHYASKDVYDYSTSRQYLTPSKDKLKFMNQIDRQFWSETGPAEADKMLMDIDPVAKAIRDFVEEYEEFHHPVIAAFEAALEEKERKTKATATMTGSSAAAQAKAKAHRARHNKGRRNRRRRQRARK